MRVTYVRYIKTIRLEFSSEALKPIFLINKYKKNVNITIIFQQNIAIEFAFRSNKEPECLVIAVRTPPGLIRIM